MSGLPDTSTLSPLRPNEPARFPRADRQIPLMKLDLMTRVEQSGRAILLSACLADRANGNVHRLGQPFRLSIGLKPIDDIFISLVRSWS